MANDASLGQADFVRVVDREIQKFLLAFMPRLCDEIVDRFESGFSDEQTQAINIYLERIISLAATCCSIKDIQIFCSAPFQYLRVLQKHVLALFGVCGDLHIPLNKKVKLLNKLEGRLNRFALVYSKTEVITRPCNETDLLLTTIQLIEESINGVGGIGLKNIDHYVEWSSAANTLIQHNYDNEIEGWYCYNESETVFVFVHGLFSDNKSCWTAENDVFWPTLLRDDQRFEQPGVFLATYYTDIMSGKYSIRDAAAEIKSLMTIPDEQQREGPICKRQIVFIAHSLGGLVVRYFLERNSELFSDKVVGLVLLASPSRGSAWANRLRFLRKYFGNKMAGELERSNDFITDLDQRFQDFVLKKKIEKLVGIDAFEQKGITRKILGFTFRTFVVKAEDTASYFGEYRNLPDTDHFSIAKPNSLQHPSHKLLWEVYYDRIKRHGVTH